MNEDRPGDEGVVGVLETWVPVGGQPARFAEFGHYILNYIRCRVLAVRIGESDSVTAYLVASHHGSMVLSTEKYAILWDEA